MFKHTYSLLTYKTLATKITKATKEFGGWGKAPYLFKFFVFFVAMKLIHLYSLFSIIYSLFTITYSLCFWQGRCVGVAQEERRIVADLEGEFAQGRRSVAQVGENVPQIALLRLNGRIGG